MGVGFLNVNAGDRQIQLMSRHQLQCVQDALAQFDFAREHRHCAIGLKA
jgi:urease beta subunit